MNEIKWKIQDYIVFLLTIGFLAYLIVSIVLDRDEKKILDDCGFAIGTVRIYAHSMGSRSPNPYLIYKYSVDGTEFEGKKHSFVPHEGVKRGDRFIVAYSNRKEKNSVMLFQYPIKQKGDFDNYLEEFKDNPPQYRRYK